MKIYKENYISLALHCFKESKSHHLLSPVHCVSYRFLTPEILMPRLMSSEFWLGINQSISQNWLAINLGIMSSELLWQTHLEILNFRFWFIHIVVIKVVDGILMLLNKKDILEVAVYFVIYKLLSLSHFKNKINLIYYVYYIPVEFLHELFSWEKKINKRSTPPHKKILYSKAENEGELSHAKNMKHEV